MTAGMLDSLRYGIVVTSSSRINIAKVLDHMINAGYQWALTQVESERHVNIISSAANR